jgi:hypothetical protein
MPAFPKPLPPCPVRVVVYNDDKDDSPPVHDKAADYNERYFRDWITKTTWWALRNGLTVTIYPEKL